MALCSPGCLRPGSKAQLRCLHPPSLPEANNSSSGLRFGTEAGLPAAALQ